MGYSAIVPLAQVLLVDFLLAAEVVLVLVEEQVPGLGLVVQLGELGEVLLEDLGFGVGLWVPGLRWQVVLRLWPGLALEREISSGVVHYSWWYDTRYWP